MRERFIEPQRFRGLLRKAYDKGAQPVDIVTVRWDASAGCESPVWTVLWSVTPKPFLQDLHIPASYRKYSLGSHSGIVEMPAVTRRITYEAERISISSDRPRRFLEIAAPCRKCSVCLKNRAKLWRRRVRAEIAASTRTWMSTFTCAPEHRVRMKILAKRNRGNEDFSSIANEMGKEFTRYLKRVREQSKVRFRYCLVVEAHKDGFPHLHAVIHEGANKLTKRQLESQWRIGFTNFRLCDESASSYVTKYLLKSNLARVRASLRYGTTYGIISVKGTEM